MTEFLRRNPLVAALAVVCAVLAAIVVTELAVLGNAPAPAAARKVAPAEAKLLPSLAAATPESSYPETASRPLWIPTRRPAPQVAAAAQQSFQRGQFVLQGVTIAGSTRIAMLKEKASGRVHRVELGRDVNGLHVAEVEPERVTLTQGAERETLDLRVQRPGAPAPGAPAAQAGQVVPPQNPAAAAAMAGAVANRSSGPFGAPSAPVPGAPPSRPSGGPMPSSGPMPPQGPQATPSPVPANPVPAAVPQQSTAPMTPEELLARRRARRNQPTE